MKTIITVRKYRRGFRMGLSLVEVLLSLAITALLLTATAVALEAAIQNYSANSNLSMASITTRNMLHQMTSTLRSAWNTPAHPIVTDEDAQECGLKDQTGQDVIYAYNATSHQLRVNINGADEWYTLVDNVYPITADTPIFTSTLADSPFPSGTVAKVEIRFKVVQGCTERAVSASVVPANVLYNNY